MAETKFKVGDEVRYLEDSSTLTSQNIYRVRALHKDNSGVANGVCLEGFNSKSDWWYFFRFELVSPASVKSAAPPKFILQYELDTDRFELFATEKELRKRIAELAERTDLKRDSIKVYDIKKVRTVTLGTKITFHK